jgi:hypothetical protein
MNAQIGTVGIELSARVKGSGPAVVMGTVQCPLVVKNMGANKFEVDFDPMMQYVAESFLAVFADPEPSTPKTKIKDSESEELACAWSDYRSAYGAKPDEFKIFKAGWEAANGAEHNGVQR